MSGRLSKRPDVFPSGHPGPTNPARPQRKPSGGRVSRPGMDRPEPCHPRPFTRSVEGRYGLSILDALKTFGFPPSFFVR